MAGLGFSLQWRIFQKTAMEVVDFCGGFFGRKMQKKNPPKKSAGKIRRKIRQPKTKNPAAHDPPEIRHPGAKSAAKPTNKSACQTSKYTPGFFSMEKVCSWRSLQSKDSGTLFGCLLVMVEAPMLKCTCNPSADAGGRGKVCCAPFQTTLLVKSVRFEKTAQK